MSAAPEHSQLEEIERPSDNRPPYILTYAEVKLLGIAGVSYSRKSAKAILISGTATGWILPRW